MRSEIGPNGSALDAASRASVVLTDDYRISAGDTLTIRVRGKVDLHFGSSKSDTGTQTTSPDSYLVKPDGTVHLPVIGPVAAVGKTVDDLKKSVTEKLSAYYKQFSVDVSVANVGLIKVWVSGLVANPGPQSLPSTATVLEAILRADVSPNGSTRRICLTRAGKTYNIDAYGIVALGDIPANMTLQAGDQIHVPPVTNWVKIEGEVNRPGQFEMIPLSTTSGDKCRASDLLLLARGDLPTSIRSRATLQRTLPSGEVNSTHCDLTGKDDPILQTGDILYIPSATDYQPTVRLVGEFKGDGVYQRVAGAVPNKTGVCKLAKGETVGDVITHTGGTTPQADLIHAKIERRKNGAVQVIPLKLDKLLIEGDKNSDVVLESGDTIVLPAIPDKVYVFGQVEKPGAFPFEPERRMVDYLASAGGPTAKAKKTVVVVRGTGEAPQMLHLTLNSGLRGSNKDNPLVQAGDIIFVPDGVVTDWRDVAQIITTVSLLSKF